VAKDTRESVTAHFSSLTFALSSEAFDCSLGAATFATRINRTAILLGRLSRITLVNGVEISYEMPSRLIEPSDPINRAD